MPRYGSHVKLQRILAPVDFSESMAGTLQHAAALAREFGAAITVLHVVKPDRSCLTRWITPAEPAEELRDAGECQLGRLIDVLRGDEIEAEVVVAIGEPDRQIVNEAKETNADLIVMGTRGAVGAWGRFRHTLASKVVRNAPCPVLAVPLFQRGFMMDNPALRSPGL